MGRRALTRLGGGNVSAAADAYPSDLADLAALRPTARAVLYLHHVEGLSFDAIAVRLTLPASSVRQVEPTRARRQLRIQLEEGS